MSAKVYWTSVEFQTDVKDENGVEYTGGFVYAFVFAKDAREALTRIEEDLNKQNRPPTVFEFVSPYDVGIKWEDEDNTKLYLDLYQQAEKAGGIIYDEFYLYEKEQ